MANQYARRYIDPSADTEHRLEAYEACIEGDYLGNVAAARTKFTEMTSNKAPGRRQVCVP